MQANDKPVWHSAIPTRCDLDGHEITTVFYDAKTVMGPWGNLCPACFKQYGMGLGTGKGQKYELQDNGRYLKTEG